MVVTLIPWVLLGFILLGVLIAIFGGPDEVKKLMKMASRMPSDSSPPPKADGPGSSM